jgi:hypothetical protein
MDIVKMMWTLVKEGDHEIVDVVGLGFDLAWARYVMGSEVAITRQTME